MQTADRRRTRRPAIIVAASVFIAVVLTGGGLILFGAWMQQMSVRNRIAVEAANVLCAEAQRLIGESNDFQKTLTRVVEQRQPQDKENRPETRRPAVAVHYQNRDEHRGQISPVHDRQTLRAPGGTTPECAVPQQRFEHPGFYVAEGTAGTYTLLEFRQSYHDFVSGSDETEALTLATSLDDRLNAWKVNTYPWIAILLLLVIANAAGVSVFIYHRLSREFTNLDIHIQALGRANSDVLHNVRGPLHIIKLWLTRSSGALETERIERKIDEVLLDSNALLDVAGRQQGPYEMVDFSTLVSRAADEHAEQLHRKGVSLELEIAERLYILGREGLLRSILLNAFQNVVAHSAPGTLRVALSRRGDRFLLQMSNPRVSAPAAMGDEHFGIGRDQMKRLAEAMHLKFEQSLSNDTAVVKIRGFAYVQE